MNEKEIKIAHLKFQEYLKWECNCKGKPFTDQIPIQSHERDCNLKVVQTFLDNLIWFNDWSKPDLRATTEVLKDSYNTTNDGVLFMVDRMFNWDGNYEA